MADLTVIYITLNKMPQSWVDFHMEHLLISTIGYPIISISRKPMDLGVNLIQTAPASAWNINMQILRGAKAAQTSYIGIAEDDTLYTPEHFNQFRPRDTEVAFDMARWSVLSWSPDIYCMRRRVGTFAMIGPRQLVIDAYTERKNKFKGKKKPAKMGELGRPIVERRLGVSHIDSVQFYSKNPIVNLSHNLGLHARPPRRGMRKRRGEMKAYDIPYWGKASDIVATFNGGKHGNT